MASQKEKRNLAYPLLCGLCGDRPTRLSQSMHNAAFSESRTKGFYVAFDIVDTSAAILAMRTLGIRGFSMTIPHKEATLTLVDCVSDDAAAIGAVNTVINDGNCLTGHNTDSEGICRAFQEAGVNLAGARVLVLGAGGAARAATYAFKALGALDIVLSSRSAGRAMEVAKAFEVRSQSYDSLGNPGSLKCYDIIANTTPLGSHLCPEEPDYPFNIKKISKGQVVFDAVTNSTPLMFQATQNGAIVIAGIRMLLHQAARQFELFTGEQAAPLAAMERALLAELGE